SGQTCGGLGFGTGALACSPRCMFDVSGCSVTTTTTTTSTTTTTLGPPPCAPVPITVGQTINGMLTTSSCHTSAVFGDQYFTDHYSFDGTAGQQVIVQATSSEIVPFLILLDPSEIATGFTGGGTARMPSTGVETLPATGTYVIEIASVAGA